MTERVFVQRIHRLLKPMDLYAWKINARYIAGVPDAWYSGTGADLWCEYKYIKVLATKTAPKRIPVELSPLQRHWLVSRHAEGRQVAVIIGVGPLAYILQGSALTETHLLLEGRPSYTPREIAAWIRDRVTAPT